MKLSTPAMAVLANSRTAGNLLYLPGDQLARPLYVEVDKALKLAGGKWNKSARAHLFPGDAEDAVQSLILTGEIGDPKKQFEAFFTPRLLAAEVCRRAGIGPGMTVLEPSAGDGALALAAADLEAVVTAVEIQEPLAAALNNTGRLRLVLCDDFLTIPSDSGAVGPFDAVVMNPPFAKQADVKHVMHALDFVKPGGVLVAIMSASVAFRDNPMGRHFRERIVAPLGEIEALPDGSFKESGTMVNTVVVTLRVPR